MSRFFDMNLIEGRDAGTADFMFASIDEKPVEDDLSWDVVCALGLDNTDANIGEHNSIKSRDIDKKCRNCNF